jgi:hypothetical protein
MSSWFEIVVLLLLLAAQTKPPAGPWRLTFQISGGFAGVDRRLELTDTGAVTATDGRRVSRATTTATAKELADIKSFLPDLKSVRATFDKNCRDCFEYRLDVQMNGSTVTLRFDETAMDNRRVETIVNALTALLDRALAGPQASPEPR